MATRKLLGLSLLAAAAACSSPPVAPPLDQCQSGSAGCTPTAGAGVIQGTVTYGGTRRGDVILVLFDKNNLPPPDGVAAAPVSVARVLAQTLFNGASGPGPFSAPYTFSAVPPGTYQVRAFLDHGGVFQPLNPLGNQPRAGDPVGGHGALDSRGVPVLTDVVVQSNAVTGGVGVLLGSEAPLDPPAFAIFAPPADPTQPPSSLASGDVAGPVSGSTLGSRLLLHAVPLQGAPGSAAPAGFAVNLRCDGSGKPLDDDHDNLPDAYPQVRLVKLSDSLTATQPYDVGSGGLTVIPAVVDTTAFAGQLSCGAPITVIDLPVQVFPLAVTATPGAAPVPLPAIPPGRYALAVVTGAGQVWATPNPGFGTTGAITVAAGPTSAGTGSITGNAILKNFSTLGNLVVAAYPAGLPPLLPVAAQVIPAGQVVNGANRFTLSGLLAGNYNVYLFDDVQGRSVPEIPVLATPSLGAVLFYAPVANNPFAPLSIAVGASPTVLPDGVVTLDASQPLLVLPFERPVFTLNAATQSGPALELDISAAAGALLPKPPGVPLAFHPRLALVDPTSPGSGPAHLSSGSFALASNVIFTSVTDPTKCAPVGVVDIRPFCSQLVSGADANCTTGTPIVTGSGQFVFGSVSSLGVAVIPGVCRVPATGVVKTASPASGKYAVTLVEATGESWTVPNTLAGPAAPDQARYYTVP